MELISELPGETTGGALDITDAGTVVVESQTATDGIYYLYDRRHRITRLGQPGNDINNDNVTTGTSNFPLLLRAFREPAALGSTTVLEPIMGDTHSAGLAINARGDVLGYSFTPGAVERIGVWRGTNFQTYFVDPDPKFVSNSLIWNERGLIVNSATSDGHSYLVPRPNVRLDLADLVDPPCPVQG